MLLIVTRFGLFRTPLCELVSDTVCKRLARQIPIRCNSRALGYVTSSKLFSKNKDLKYYTLVTRFNSNTNTTIPIEEELSSARFEKVSDETLESLTEYFDELVEQASHLPDADVSYGDGVLTVKFGEPHGTYVINRQSPNKQIWLSSPVSGPKRYDFINGKWIYKHDGKSLHELLNSEVPVIVKSQVCFDKCSFSGRDGHVTTSNV